MDKHTGPVARARRRGPGEIDSQSGQSMAEFALILTPLMVVLLGIMQMGLVLSSYVTLSNAAREGARAATVYVYDRTLTSPTTKGANDANRRDAAYNAATSAMGLLSRVAPQFSSADFVLTYPCDATPPTPVPAGCGVVNDQRTGQYVRIQMTYHLDLFIPFISAVLPKDAGGRLPLTADTTMVVN